jgi:DNA adenine methylase
MSVPHPIPYQGSKRQLADRILQYFPTDNARLVEPFAGSAAITVAALAQRRVDSAWISDTDVALIALWRQIMDCPEVIADAYERLWTAQLGRERTYYDEVRSRFNQTRQPADYLYLLARCVKAAVRYNAQGEFNQSPDNRRKGARPETMRQQIMGVSRLLNGRVCIDHADYRDIVSKVTEDDIVYMDPPYQGVCKQRDPRYRKSIMFENFVDVLRDLNKRNIAYIVSYDGRTDKKQHGLFLPDSLNLQRTELHAGRSSQATLLGRTDVTYESLYLSPALLQRLSLTSVKIEGLHRPEQLPLFELPL